MAQSIYNYFHNNENEEVVKRLLSKNIKPQKQKVISSKTLSEMTIVVTGSLENFTRQQIEQTIKDHGGKSTSSVSKNTTFVLAGENPGSKIEKAQELSVKIIDEKQFMELIQKDSV